MAGSHQPRQLLSIRQALRYTIAIVLLIAIAGSGLATMAAFRDIAPFHSDPDIIALLLSLDVALLVLAVLFVASNVFPAMRAHGVFIGSADRLKNRLVRVFVVVAMVPILLITLVSAFMFDLGLESWFSNKVRSALDESNRVAGAYLLEHIKGINADTLIIARALGNRWQANSDGRARINATLAAFARSRNITQAIVFDQARGTILARYGITFSLEFDLVPEWALERARAGESVILSSEQEDRIRAIARIDNYLETYLMVARRVDPEVLKHIEAAGAARSQFEQLESQRGRIQFSYSAVLILLALVLILLAIWIALRFASAIIAPLEQLVDATEKVRDGDLTVRLARHGRDDEINHLGQAFNRMVQQIAGQQSRLLEASQRIDERRRFLEAVLGGVRAGVIGLDHKGRIDVSNRRASQLLDLDLARYRYEPLAKLVPEFEALIEQAYAQEHLIEQASDPEQKIGDKVLLVRMTPQWNDGLLSGIVVTFDDITGLILAQRKAAWSDVARRIAHEVRNPLTPIQLSVERLRRRFARQITMDQELYSRLLDTIIRQVQEIGRLVGEFSNFARMPAPIMARTNLVELCRQVVLLQETVTPICQITCLSDSDVLEVECDKHQIAQLLTNIIKNAREAIMLHETRDQGQIEIKLDGQDPNLVMVEILDNGPGFPADRIHLLTQPYVTLREQGTGLGLAIVRKIVEDHGGQLRLGNREQAAGGYVSFTIARHHPPKAKQTGLEQS
ncbi:MAG: ATP-binding protein [Pseudomonadota bacterium]